jgi:hypothetical protein
VGLRDLSLRDYIQGRAPVGSRLAAVIPPCSVGGTTLTIDDTIHVSYHNQNKFA